MVRSVILYSLQGCRGKLRASLEDCRGSRVQRMKIVELAKKFVKIRFVL